MSKRVGWSKKKKKSRSGRKREGRPDNGPGGHTGEKKEVTEKQRRVGSSKSQEAKCTKGKQSFRECQQGTKRGGRKGTRRQKSGRSSNYQVRRLKKQKVHMDLATKTQAQPQKGQP